MKTLQRELHFDYGTNLARLRCLPPQSNALYIKSCASSENHPNIPALHCRLQKSQKPCKNNFLCCQIKLTRPGKTIIFFKQTFGWLFT